MQIRHGLAGLFLRPLPVAIPAVFLSCCLASGKGIPEPGLLLYGSVTAQPGGLGVVDGVIAWDITGNGETVRVVCENPWAVINGRAFYRARVPFETRVVGGRQFSSTTNTLGLATNAVTYTRAASYTQPVTLQVHPAVVTFSSRGALQNFTFGASDRGVLERVDLEVNVPVTDTDKDGMSDLAELYAGTDPKDPQSVLKLVGEIEISPTGGLIIKWSSVAGKAYLLQRATRLGDGPDMVWTVLVDNIEATPPQNRHADATATGNGPFFYRLTVK